MTNDLNTKKEDESETLKTFDMYRFFSRVDVILAIVFTVLALLVMLYLALTDNQTV